METTTTTRARKPKVCKTCERLGAEIAKREELLECRDSHSVGMGCTEIRLETYRKQLTEHVRSRHSGG